MDEETKVNKEIHNFDIILHTSLGLASGLSTSFFPVLATRLGASPWLLALISSSPYLTNLLAPFWVNEAKRFGTRYLILGSLLLSSLVLFILTFTHSAIIFSLLVSLYYLFYGISEPMYVSLAEVVYQENASKYLGKIESIFDGVHGIANLIGGWILNTLGTVTAFIIASISTIVAALSYLPFPNLKSEDSDSTTTPWKILTEHRIIKRIVLVFMISGTGMLMMLPAMPIIEVNKANLTNLQIGFLLGLNSLSLIIFSRLWGNLNESPSHLTTTFRIGMLSITLMAIIYAISKSFYALLIANFFCGIGGSAISVGWQIFAINIMDYNTDDLAALHLFTCGIRGLYAPALGALITSLTNPKFTMLISSAFLFVGLLLLPSNKEIIKNTYINEINN